MKTVLYLLGVVVVACLLSSSALALTALGPPKAELDYKQYSAGFLFASGEMDLKISGYGLSETMTDIESTTYLSRLSVGLSYNCELYGLLGISDLSAEDFDGSSEFAGGFGTKFTVAEKDSVTWGGVFQMCSINSDGSVSGDVPGFGMQTMDVDIQALDIQIAFGPTYTKGVLSIYGGPFLHFVDGDMDATLMGETITLDIEQESELGGYVGGQYELTENTSWFGEFQSTGDAWAFGTGFVWRF